MKNLDELNVYRLSKKDLPEYFGGWEGDHTCGAFGVPQINGPILMVIASSGEGWDHVSVSLPNRCPSWAEMEHVKRTFFRDDETAMQLHVPPSQHINRCKNCLHLWRPHKGSIPRPPSHLVG